MEQANKLALELIALLTVLINPVTLAIGAYLSQFLESLTWFKRQDVPGGQKFAAVFGLCELAALALMAFNATALPTDWQAWRAFILTTFLTGLSIAIGSQVLHVLIKQYVPWAGGWFLELLRALKLPAEEVAGTATATVTNSSGRMTQAKVEIVQPSLVMDGGVG